MATQPEWLGPFYVDNRVYNGPRAVVDLNGTKTAYLDIPKTTNVNDIRINSGNNAAHATDYLTVTIKDDVAGNTLMTFDTNSANNNVGFTAGVPVTKATANVTFNAGNLTAGDTIEIGAVDAATTDFNETEFAFRCIDDIDRYLPVHTVGAISGFRLVPTEGWTKNDTDYATITLSAGGDTFGTFTTQSTGGATGTANTPILGTSTGVTFTARTLVVATGMRIQIVHTADGVDLGQMKLWVSYTR